MRIFHFTTVVSISYIYKFLAMQDSLSKCCTNYHLFALCIDEEVYQILSRLPLINITILSMAEVETAEILEAKQNRNYHEYCWTLKPFMLKTAMKRYKDTLYFAHIDADLFFFSDPTQIIKENLDASLFLTDHNNSERFLHTYSTSGIYNTGFVCCKNDTTANLAVDWWLDRCLEKCSLVANVEEELYGDQKYVEKWPKLYPDVHIVKTKGANVAQWNIEGFQVSQNLKDVYVNDNKLIFYHFSGFSIINEKEFNLATFYRIQESPHKLIYVPYIKAICKAMNLVTHYFPNFSGGMIERQFVNFVHYERI